MNEVFRAILSQADLQDARLFAAHEVERWPNGALDWLTKVGILREAQPAEGILCDECEEGCLITPKIRENPQTGQRFGVYFCQKNDVGRFTIDLDRKKQWRFSLMGLATAVARAVSAVGQQVELVHERLVFLGTANLDGKSRELFLARGVAWPDSKGVFGNASRLRAVIHPVILTLVAALPRDLLPGTTLDGRPLAEIATFDNSELLITIEGAIPVTEPWPKVAAAKLTAQDHADTKEQPWADDAPEGHSPSADEDTPSQNTARAPRGVKAPSEIEKKIAAFYAESNPAKTQGEVAVFLNKKMRDELAKASNNGKPLFPLTQQKVSRIIRRANRFRKANGMPEIQTRNKASTSPEAFAPAVDPAVIDLGPRQDHKAKSSRQVSSSDK